MIACTVALLSELPFVRTLANSYLSHHPLDSLNVLIVDDPDGTATSVDEPFRVIGIEDVGITIAELHRMAMLSGRNVTTALKPWLVDYLLRRYSEPVTFLDNRTLVLGSLAKVSDTAKTSGVVLVPHILDPLPRDGLDPDETTILGMGMFSSAFFSVGLLHGGFTDFLKDRLSRECLVDIPHMRLLDQRWFDFAPSLFPYRVERDPGVNAGYWNLHERPLERDGGRLLAGGSTLRSFNFSGFDPRLDGAIGRSEATDSPRIFAKADPILTELCKEYRNALMNCGFDTWRTAPFGFETLANGLPIYDGMRALYAGALSDAEENGTELPPDPFDPATDSEFRSWIFETYASQGFEVPQLLREVSPSPTPVQDESRLRLLYRRLIDREVHRAASTPSMQSMCRPTIDCMRSLEPQGAGRWNHSMIDIDPTESGIVASGPLGRLGTGHYSLSLELLAGPRHRDRSGHDQAMVVEVHAVGHLLAFRTVSIGELETSRLDLDFVVPAERERDSLMTGTRVRIRSRERVSVALQALLLTRIDDTTEELPTRVDWLPIMDAGDAGRRAGVEVNARSDTTGMVLSGPCWRLSPGKYLARIGTRIDREPPVRESSLGDNGPIGAVSIIDREVVLAETPLSWGDISHGQTVIPFEITAATGRSSSGVDIQIRSKVPTIFAINSLEIERVQRLE